MFGLGAMELSIILVLVVIIFGAGRLPELGSGLGTGIKNFKKGLSDDKKNHKSITADENSSSS